MNRTPSILCTLTALNQHVYIVKTSYQRGTMRQELQETKTRKADIYVGRFDNHARYYNTVYSSCPLCTHAKPIL